MQKQERLVIKQLGGKQNIRENLPKYAGILSRDYMGYALIQLAMNLYTFQERREENSNPDPFLSEVLDQIQKWTGYYVLDKRYGNREEERKQLYRCPGII